MGSPLKPSVFLIGETTILQDQLHALLDHLGAPTWQSDAGSDIERLTEVYGRACYKSFGIALNPNLTQVRKHSLEYLQNVIAKGDGSIFEHAQTNWFFADVSRVFTHELVRHRAGTAISQESLRFVRLTDLNWFAPVAVEENDNVMTFYAQKFEELSELQRQLSDMFGLDSGLSFDQKKKLTSTMRRLAPMGLATNIGWSCNLRSLRHVIEMRTDPVAEEEIRLVFAQVAEIARERWPHIFADYDVEDVDGIPWWHTKNKKV